LNIWAHVSFDVKNLFSSIPVIRAIDIVINKAFPKYAKKFHGLTRKQLKTLLIDCTTKAHFVFNEKFYDQADGVSMGCPLAPLLAKAYMNNFEKVNMNKLNEIGVTTWMRYVDDVFSQVKKDADINEVLLTLNSLDKNIEFTVELAKDNKLPFLDTCVVRNLTNYRTKSLS
jgi:hypothetical protein